MLTRLVNAPVALSKTAMLPLLVSRNCVVPIAPMVSGGRKHWPRAQLSSCEVPSKPRTNTACAEAAATAVSADTAISAERPIERPFNFIMATAPEIV